MSLGCKRCQQYSEKLCTLDYELRAAKETIERYRLKMAEASEILIHQEEELRVRRAAQGHVPGSLDPDHRH